MLARACVAARWSNRMVSVAQTQRGVASSPTDGRGTGRGAFILFEGGDRCGKTTQAANLLEHLQRSGVKAELWKFPDRTTQIGRMIDSYLASKTELDDAAVHLLFAANRQEKRQALLEALSAGTSLVVDRYAFSGVAFSAAKQLPHLNLAWCKAPDAGLPAPDVVLWLRMPPEAAAARGGYGGERYEKLTFQHQVDQEFEALQDDTWHVVDAAQSIQAVEQQVLGPAMAAVAAAAAGAPLRQLWSDPGGATHSRAAKPPTGNGNKYL